MTRVVSRIVNRLLALRIQLALVSTLLIAGFVVYCRCELRAKPGRQLYPVMGTVIVNGQPAMNVNVAFHPIDCTLAGLCPVGRTDRAGEFRLTTNSAFDGAPPGKFNITFVWPEPTSELDECIGDDPLVHDQFRGLYSHPDESGYQATVSETSQSFRFNLWRPRSEDPILYLQ